MSWLRPDPLTIVESGFAHRHRGACACCAAIAVAACTSTARLLIPGKSWPKLVSPIRTVWTSPISYGALAERSRHGADIADRTSARVGASGP